MLKYTRNVITDDYLWSTFTCSQEYSSNITDQHRRFAYSDSKNINIVTPIVWEHITNKGVKPIYPNGKQFAVCLTHDVDDIYPPFTHTIASTLCTLKSLDIKEFYRQWAWKLDKKKSPYLNFQHIMEIEQKYNARSAFYFLATDKDIRRKRYDINTLKAGYYSYDNVQDIITEKQKIEDIIGSPLLGCRNHYLRFKTPDTWEVLADAGFKYDTTYGYHDMIGFRNGMCAPFIPYNLNTEQYINIVEFPLNIMDGTLFGAMGLSVDEAKARITELIDTVASLNGVLTVLWHNNIFGWPYRKQWADLYEWLLGYASSKGAWLTSPDQLYIWTTNKNVLNELS